MRIAHRYLQWDSHPEIINDLRAILGKYNIGYNYKEDLDSVISTFKYQLEFYLYEDNPNFAAIKKEVDRFGIVQQSGTVYEKADIKAAEWFIASAGQYQYPQPEEDFNYKKTTFNLDNYCDLCAIGKIQNAPFRLKSVPKQHNNQFWGLFWENAPLFVRQEAKNILEKENIQGIRFSKPVLHKTNLEIEGFYQLHIETVLTKGFDSYNTKTITCKINNEENLNTGVNPDCCGRIKFHHPMIGGYLFDKTIFHPGVDIAETYEYFGSGGSADKLVMVSKRFKEIVEKNKLKGLSFKPVVHQRLLR